MGWTMPLCENCVEDLKERGEQIKVFSERQCNCYYCGDETDRPVYDTYRE